MKTIRHFLKQYDKAVKFPALYPLSKPKQEIGSIFFKDELFAHFFLHAKENCSRKHVLLFVLSVTRSVVSPSKSFKPIVSKTFHQRFLICNSAKCITFTKNVILLPQVVEFLKVIMTCDSNFLAQVLYQDQNIMQLLGDIHRLNKKCRAEKCVYLTSFEEIMKSTKQCKQCKTWNHVLNIPFKHQKPCDILLG